MNRRSLLRLLAGTAGALALPSTRSYFILGDPAARVLAGARPLAWRREVWELLSRSGFAEELARGGLAPLPLLAALPIPDELKWRVSAEISRNRDLRVLPPSVREAMRTLRVDALRVEQDDFGLERRLYGRRAG